MTKDPLIQKHIDQSSHNEKLVNLHLSGGNLAEFIDWAITTTFYYAVHRMQAALLNDFNYYPEKHEDERMENSRNQLVSKLYGQAANLYLFLFHESQKARYKPLSYQKFDQKFVESRVRNALKEFSKYPQTDL